MKQKIFAIFTILLVTFSAISPSVSAMAATGDAAGTDEWPTGPSIYAESAIVMEASSGLILYEKNIDAQNYPASITKIMSALLAIENSSLSDVVTFSKEAVFDVDLDSSRIGIDVGEQLTMQQCLYGMLLESANEVTYAVAEHVGGTVPEFVTMMNERAKSIGCLNTHFTNPHGLPDDDHYTSAYDMALITREAMKNETFRKIFGTRTYQIPPTNLQSEIRYLRNHHRFILNQEYTYDGAIGGKTGYTTKALYTLVSVAKRGDLELICVIMRDDSFEHQYTDTQKLLDYGYDNFSIYPVSDLENTQTLDESPLFTRYNALLSETESPIVTAEDGYLVLPNTASFKDAQKEVTFYPAKDSTSDGDVIGTISYTYNNKYVGGADILYNSEEKPSLASSTIEKENPTVSSDESSPEKSDGSLRPLIIGGIVGLILLLIGLYFVIIERPRLKRKNAYYKKRAHRKSHRNDDFYDL
jgi:D-alanyl-D-alanine carboxypeptidase